jgi:hypothetical protein
MAEPFGVWRGVAHVHSTRSFDGRCDYPRLRALLAGAGFHFACMTEHIEGLGQAEVDAILADCRAHSDDHFLFVPGIEMDCFTIYFLGLGPVQVDFSSERAIYASLRAASRLCVLSHPVKAGFRYPDWILRDCDAVEVLNAKHDGRFFFRPQSERLLAHVQGERRAVVPVVGMDLHGPEGLCGVHMRLRMPGPLTADFVLEELAAGRTDLYNGERRLDDASLVARTYWRARIRAMDAAQRANLTLRRWGLRAPRGLRRTLARMLEGR